MKVCKNFPKFVLVLLLPLSPTMSCKGPGKISNNSDKIEITSDSPKIAFLNFSIRNDTLQPENSVRLINKIITDGRLKEKPQEAVPAPGDLKYIVSDKNLNELESNYISNPLKQTLEFPSENGQLGKKTIQSDNAQFSLRLQLEPGARYISLKQFAGQNSGLIHLLTIDIFQND